MDFLTVIPARANSQRLPRKNMKILGGVPLVGHCIEYAQNNQQSVIVVTTNDLEVAAYAKKEGVKVINRPYSLAGNEEPVITAIQHALANISEHYDAVVLLQPTNPLRPKKLLKEALEVFEGSNCDSLMTVSKNKHKLGTIENAVFKPYNYSMGQRSQDMEPLYYENGLLYIFKTELLKEGKLLGKKNYPLVVDHPFAEIDIDTEADFKKAEMFFNYYKNIDND